MLQVQVPLSKAGTMEKSCKHAQPTMETCVVITWLKLNYDLLAVTGNPFYENSIETTYYNALMGSTKIGGTHIEMCTPLEGSRGDYNHQCGMYMNCCSANGPRGYMMMPCYAVMTSGNEVYINLYTNSKAAFKLQNNNKIEIKQTTIYPKGESIQFNISTDKPEKFTLAFRIPSWSIENSITINGEKTEGFAPGSYAKISREWKNGDEIILTLDLQGRVVELNGHSAILRGPLVLTRDSRFNDGFVDEAAVIQQKNGKVDIQICGEKPEGVWLSFTAPMKMGTGIESTGNNVSQIHLCDFGSAGNTWGKSSRYRVWLSKPLNVMKTKYIEY